MNLATNPLYTSCVQDDVFRSRRRAHQTDIKKILKRIDKLEAMMPRVKPLYEQNKGRFQ